MDKSDLQTLLRFALQNNVMNKSFIQVFKWYNIQNSLAYNQHNRKKDMIGNIIMLENAKNILIM